MCLDSEVMIRFMYSSALALSSVLEFVVLGEGVFCCEVSSVAK